MSNVRDMRWFDPRRLKAPGEWWLDEVDNVLVGPGGHEEPAPDIRELERRFELNLSKLTGRCGTKLAPRGSSDMDMYADVFEFMSKHGQVPKRMVPSVPGQETVKLRVRLMCEEFEETLQAIEDGDMVEMADGLADLIYVALGTAIAYGIDLRGIWKEVHRSNMDKVAGDVNSDGKVMKPHDWEPPKIQTLLDRLTLLDRSNWPKRKDCPDIDDTRGSDGG